MSEHAGHYDFLIDDPSPAVHSVLKEFGLQMDPMFRGEIARLLDLPGYRRAYLRKRGLTVEGLAEMLWSRGITRERLSTVDVLEVLELVMVNGRGKAAKRRRSAEALSEIDREALRARKNRERKYQCPECQQIGRGTRASAFLCGLCYQINRRIVEMVRVDPLPEEILEQVAGATA